VKPFFFFGARVMHHYGQRAAGDGPGTSYRAYDASNSIDLQGAADWRPLPWLDVRPGLATGIDWISGHTIVGRRAIVDRRFMWSFGPYLRAIVHARRAFGYGPYVGPFVGIEGDARFVPQQMAAPRAAPNLIWGAAF